MYMSSSKLYLLYLPSVKFGRDNSSMLVVRSIYRRRYLPTESGCNALSYGVNVGWGQTDAVGTGGNKKYCPD
jgi:hypothetical protein